MRQVRKIWAEDERNLHSLASTAEAVFPDKIDPSSLGQPMLFRCHWASALDHCTKGPALETICSIWYRVIAMGVLFPAVFSGVEIIWDRQFGS